MIYTVKPVAARLLKSGDTFRDGGYTHRVLTDEKALILRNDAIGGSGQ